MSKILLVEDDRALGLSLEISLASFGHEVVWCRGLAQARAALRGGDPDLVLLDLGLPDGDGLDLCAEIRARGSTVPILVLTARGTLQARVDGLRTGADDYVCKPFDLEELLARVDALLRRRGWTGPGPREVIGCIEVDFRSCEAWRGDEPVTLTALELRILRYLLERRGQTVSRPQLLANVWELAPDCQTRTVDVYMSRLRKLLELDPGRPRHLISVRGVGYRLDP